MQITALYEDRNNALTTAQVFGQPDGDRGFDLEASLQFVNGTHAVEFDFSAFCVLEDDRGNLNEEKERILAEIAAVNRLVEQVNSFHTAFIQAANKGLDYLDSLV